MASMNDVAGGFMLPSIQLTTGNLSGTTASASVLSGSAICIVNSATNNGTLMTRTAAQMVADSGLAPGQQWWLLLVNSGATNPLTLGGGTNVTISGTATVAAVTARLYIAAVASTGLAITFTNVGFSFTATALAFGV